MASTIGEILPAAARRFGARTALIVILKPSAEATREELVAHCRQHLAAYKVPRAIQFTEQVPTTTSGRSIGGPSSVQLGEPQ